MKELMKKRQQTFRTQCVKYSRYVLNDHFVLFMLIFIGFLAVQYSKFLQELPKEPSLIRWTLLIGLLFLVPIGSIATYLEKPDALFLLVKEEEIKNHIKGQSKKSFVFWLLIQSFILLLFVPLFLATGMNALGIVIYFFILGSTKWLVFSWKATRFYQDGNLNWVWTIAHENARKQLILRFFALFTTVKGITNSVKRRAYLDRFLGLLPKTHGNTWLHLYMRSFLRNGDLFSMTLRLLLLSILAMIFIPQTLVVIALVALLNYLIIFQLLGLYSAFDYQPLTLLFPTEKGSKKAGLNKTIRLLMGIVTVTEGAIGLVFMSDKVLLLGLLAYTLALTLIYLPFKMTRLVDESR